jgi:CRISPR/Cas system-associated exonuclease Cas4 (RecB family)
MAFNISTSEVATFLTCKQRWMYAHHPSYNLEPRSLGIALTRGLIGHEALEIYYRTLMEGKSESEARMGAQHFILKKGTNEINTGDSEKAKMIGSLGVRLSEYFDKGQEFLKGREIIGVEHKVIVPLTEDINFAGRIDLVLGINSGPNKNEAEPHDHKFTYNFWPDIAVNLNAQISNYIWALRELGYRSRNGFLNMIRYREDAKEEGSGKFKSAPVPTNSTMRTSFIMNHLEAAKKIVDLKIKPKVGLAEGVTRSTSKFNCEYCPFATLCLTESQGLDSSLMIKASYRPNSYGYDSELDVA